MWGDGPIWSEHSEFDGNYIVARWLVDFAIRLWAVMGHTASHLGCG